MDNITLVLVAIGSGLYIIYSTLEGLRKGEVKVLSPYARKPLSFNKDRNSALVAFVVQLVAGIFALLIGIILLVYG